MIRPMSYLWVNLLHVLGAFLLFTALGAMTLHQMEHGSASQSRWSDPARKLAGATHGIALLLLLVTGLYMLMDLIRVGTVQGMGGWVWGKLLLWLVFGGIIVLVRRAPERAGLLWWGLPLLGAVAVGLCLFKPGG